MKLFLSLLISACTLAACNETKTSSPTVKKTEPTMVGNDADEHGCKASAGYTWSVLKNDCVRVWETGIQLSPVENDKSYTTNATLIISDDKTKIELFIADENHGIILLKQIDKEPSVYSAKDYFLSSQNNKWLLKKGDKVIYKN